MAGSPPIFTSLVDNGTLTGHVGPFPMPEGGTLVAEQRKDILNKTGCSASVRLRTQWESRCLTIAGPVDKLQEAYNMASAFIKDKIHS